MEALYFVLRLRNAEAASIVCGPVSGAEAYSAFAMASMDEDTGAVIVLPSNVVSDLLGRCGVLV
jgi:hypothetical protein